ncbi:MAG: TonB-dependent receptor [Flavobacteriales bacterium]|jgi:outer membrane receptor for ferrienterochelin and colicins|nr:TonB-dependent receptor [Flavobacteriales bacterium]MBK7113166.1 TonB-dependent receptor [Flavobacteriales bacterium]MBK8530528.1 TonB-dependent receptor [Flavobacteriales bacterium]MBK8709721.1 TonB-dependent receptor [Flavobacteriales bacterium]MBP8876657.1 TonB-dependent receptor [Flavobacteriales bacterium]
MTHRILALALCMHGACAMAQIPIQVGDADAKPVPYAHLAWQCIGSEGHGLVVMDAQGKGAVPVDHALAQKGVAIRVSFVGYATVSDTIHSGDGVGYHFMLRPAALGLPEFVVTGQYAPASPEKAVHRVRVIDSKQFQRMAANNLGDALRNELNVQLAQDNVLGTSLSMQGLGGQNVKLLIDGVPVIGRQDGNVDLAQIDLTTIDRVEIIQGPLSVNYGTNALAGTINLITRKGSGYPATLKASTYAEHIGRLNTTVTATCHWNKNDLVLSTGRNFFNGWDPRQSGIPSLSPTVADSTRFQQWKPREQYFGRVNYRWSGSQWSFGYKGEGLHDRIVNRGRPRAPYNETAFDEVYTTIRLDNAVFTEAKFDHGRRVNALAAYNSYARSRNTWFRDLTTLEDRAVIANDAQDTTRFDLVNVRAVFANAPDSAKWSYEAGIDVNVERGFGARIGDGRESIGDHAAFASLEYRPIGSVVIRPGLRYAYNTRYDAPVIPSVNVRWDMHHGFTMRASYAQGFRAPSLKELYFYFVDVNHDIIGSPDLAAERSHSVNAALSYRHAKDKGVYTSEVSCFYNQVEDLISLAQIAATRYTYINVGRYRTLGGSIGAGWDNGHWLISTGAAITGRYDEFAALNDEPFLFSPELRASVTKQWLRKGWSGSVFWKWQGRISNYVVADEVDVQRSFIAPYAMADASLTKHLWKDRLSLTAGCKDLFNVRNVNASLASGVHSGGANTVPMTTGRTAFVRLELELQRTPR